MNPETCVFVRPSRLAEGKAAKVVEWPDHGKRADDGCDFEAQRCEVLMRCGGEDDLGQFGTGHYELAAWFCIDWG
jgi:hypothetical protein